MNFCEFTGDVFFCDIMGYRIQPTIINLETGKRHKPVLTKNNKAFSKFIAYSSFVHQIESTGFLFTCALFEGNLATSLHMKNIKIYLDKEQFNEKFAEFLV